MLLVKGDEISVQNSSLALETEGTNFSLKGGAEEDSQKNRTKEKICQVGEFC